MYCGNCFRDNALVQALRQAGHTATMVPLYLPFTLDDKDTSAGMPVFFGGITVYLQEKSNLFRSAPNWLRDVLALPGLLRAIGRFAAKTRPENLGTLTISMLRGEEGNQARELDELIRWLKTQPKPDAVCLSNAMLAGMVRKIRLELGVPVVCMLQGEESFLDALDPKHRDLAWITMAERVREADLIVAPSRYFANRMAERLSIPASRVTVVPNGIKLDGFAAPDQPATASSRPASPSTRTIGFFARMCPEKGLDTLVEAFVILKERGGSLGLRLRIGGSCGPGDTSYVEALRARLTALGLLGSVDFVPNPSRDEKIAFLKSLDVFSVPALYGEAFGLYLLEAMAAGVPVVQPRAAAFPELIEDTGGGVLCEPRSATALANAIESLLSDPISAKAMGERGRMAVQNRYSAQAMAAGMLKALTGIKRDP